MKIDLKRVLKTLKTVFYLLIPCYLLAVFADFMVTYTVYCYDVNEFVSRESNQMFKDLFIADPLMAAVSIVIISGIVLGVVLFVHWLSLFCLKHDSEKLAIVLECSVILVLLYLSGGHIIGTLSWTVPLPFWMSYYLI